MSASVTRASPASDSPVEKATRLGVDGAWRPIYRLAGIAALLSIACVAVAIAVFVISPPPSTVTGWFQLFHRSGLLGVLDLDLMMLVSFALMGVIYLALYGALRRASGPFMALAALCGYVSIAAYFASNPAFNMLWLSGQYAAATSEAQRAQALAAGQAVLAMWQGSAFVVSYLLASVATLIIAAMMLRNRLFGKATAYVGLVLGALTVVPATAGTLGAVLSLVALVPTVLWLLLLARGFFQLARVPRWPRSDEGAARDHAAHVAEAREAREAREAVEIG